MTWRRRWDLHTWHDWVDRGLVVSAGICTVSAVVLSAWIVPQPGEPDRALELFGATGSMGGFMLAALALVLASEGTTRVKALTKAPVWNRLLRALLASMWAWSGAALLAFVYWWVGWPALWVGVVALSAGAVVTSVRAMFMVSLLVMRFRSL